MKTTKSTTKKIESKKNISVSPEFGKVYYNLGVGFMIALVIIFILQVFTLVTLVWFPTVLMKLLGKTVVFTPYTSLLFLLSLIVSILFVLWGIIIARQLMKTNKYTPQLAYFIYTYVILKIIGFILYIFAAEYMFGDLIIALLVWFVLLYYDNIWSRLILGKPLMIKK